MRQAEDGDVVKDVVNYRNLLTRKGSLGIWRIGDWPGNASQ